MIVLPDTSIVVAGLRGNARVLDRLEAIEPEDLVLAAPVFAELLTGVHTSTRPEENMEHLLALAAGMRFEPFGSGAARRFGELKADRLKHGKAITDFDLAIAAMALDLGAILASHDGVHKTASIPGLTVEDWLDEPSS